MHARTYRPACNGDLPPALGGYLGSESSTARRIIPWGLVTPNAGAHSRPGFSVGRADAGVGRGDANPAYPVGRTDDSISKEQILS